MRLPNNGAVQAIADTPCTTSYYNNDKCDVLQNNTLCNSKSIKYSCSGIDDDVALVHIIYTLIDQLTMIRSREAVVACCCCYCLLAQDTSDRSHRRTSNTPDSSLSQSFVVVLRVS